VIHKNVRPANLVLTGDDRVVLINFGLSARWGTSPPAIEEPSTPASDVYGLAVTAHTLLTGAPPGSGAVPRLTGLSDAEAEGVLWALRRGLDPDPTRRPPSPSALLEEIRAGATTLMLPPADPPALEEDVEVEADGTEAAFDPDWDVELDVEAYVESRVEAELADWDVLFDHKAIAGAVREGKVGTGVAVTTEAEPDGDADSWFLPEPDRAAQAARSSRLRGGLVAVLVVLVGVTLLQVRTAQAERNQARRLQMASVAQALAARVDDELAAGRHERAALLARQADLFHRQSGAAPSAEIDRVLRAALTAPNFSRVVNTSRGGLWSLALSPDGTRLASAGSAVRPDGRTLATGGDDPSVRLWDLSAPGAAPVILEGHTERVTSLAFGFAGQRLATASQDGTVRLWDLATTPRSASVLNGHAGAVTAVAFSADGARLASGGADGQVRIWDVAQPAAVATLPAGVGVDSLAYSPDGRFVATGGSDGAVRLWDLAVPGVAPRLLAGHTGPVPGLAFSPDGETLASAGDDRTVRLWPLSGEAPPTVLTGHGGRVSSVAFGSSGDTLVSSSADGTARLWQLGEPATAGAILAKPDVDRSVLADLVCQAVGRNLSLREWRDFVGPGVGYQRSCPELPPG
jgi:WD40 repeat protein